MDSQLLHFLKSVNTDGELNGYTHLTSYDHRKRWTIKAQQQEQFWQGYCGLVSERADLNDAKFCLAERPKEMMPVIASLILKFHYDDENTSWEPYDDLWLAELCSIYQRILFENFKLSDDLQLELIVTVLETDHWTEIDSVSGDKLLVCEIRLQFPYAIIDAGLQTRIIRSRVIQLLHKHNVLGKLPRAPIGSWDQIIDASAIDHPIMMYGSSEFPNRPKLKLEHIWPWITEEMIKEGIAPEELALETTFIPSNHENVQSRAVSEDIFLDNDFNFWLPMFLSIHYWPTVMLPKTNDNERFSVQQTKQFQQTPLFPIGGIAPTVSWKHSTIDEKELDLCEQLLHLINQSRFYQETSWLDIGKALHHAENGGEDGMLSWLRHSEKAIDGMAEVPAFMKARTSLYNTCRSLYLTFASNDITIATLGWYARLDSPEKYVEWHKNWALSAMTRSMSLTHTDVAVAVYRSYWLDYAFDPVSDKFYKYFNHRWIIDNKNLDIKKMLSSDFVRRFELIQSQVADQVRTASNDDEATKSNGQIALTRIANVIKNLKNVPFKSNIVTELKELFKKDNFAKLLDSNPNLLGVSNGLIEIANKRAIFRAGKPEDYISMKSPVVYIEDFNWDTDIVQECMDWFRKVFPDPKLLHHFLKFSASCLKGRNSDKLFPIFTGEGNNSKSMIVKLFEKTFGDYCVKFDISNVTSRNGNPNAPSPQLARSKATRLAFMDEPEDDIPLNKGVLKRWIGGDSFFCRMLQDNGGDVEVTFKLILTCNKVPFIPKDTAITNRVDLYPFLGTWSRDAPASPEEQDRLHIYPLDELFENKIPALSLGFIWMITQYYVYYATEGLKDKPQIVIDTTEAYWRENDVYAQFAADCITEVIRDGVRDNSARVSLNQVYDEFKNWYKNSFPALKIPTRPVVKSELVSRWGKLAGKYWFGIKIIDDDEVIDIKSIAKKPVLLGEAAVITTKKRENPTLPEDNLVSEKSTKKVKTNAAAEGTVAF